MKPRQYGHEAKQPGPEQHHQANAQARIPGCHGAGGPLGRIGFADRALRPREWSPGPAALCGANPAAHPLHAAVVQAQRPRHGRSPARRARLSGLCRPVSLGRAHPRVHGCKFATREQARQAVMNWMAFYNHRRLHSSLGYLSPMQYEQRWYEAQRKKAA